MKNHFLFYSVLIGLSIIYSCSKEDTGKLPEVLSAINVTDITAESATFGGEVKSDGGKSLIATGVCWSTNPNPTILDNITNEGNYVGIFKRTLLNLTPGTSYNVRAYATNSIGTAYGNTLSFSTLEKVIDIDGNSYHTITIGSQTWLVENLKTTKYNDGTPITLLTDQTLWPYNYTPASYCWYNNDIQNKDEYGALYNWKCVSTGKLAPIGWHVATLADVNLLYSYTKGVGLKESGTTHWKSPNYGIGNKYGFTALPAGYCNGGFACLTIGAFFWTSTPYNDYYSMRYDVGYNSDNWDINPDSPSYGRSVRCVKN